MTVLIAGFHRSGTSAVARAFHRAGLHMGDTLLGSEPANPYGHFEDEVVIDLHDSLLTREGLTWKSTSPVADRSHARALIAEYAERRGAQSTGLWGVKDPRVCLFLPEWLAAAPRAEVIFVARPPGPAIASLHRRHIRRFIDTAGIDDSDLAFRRDPDLGLKLWCHYHEQALPALSQHSHVTIVDYASAVADEVIHASIARLGLNTDEVTSFDRTLGQDATTWLHDPALGDRARSLWTQLHTLTP